MPDQSPIYLYNTLTRQKDLFLPIKKNEVKIYSCGPTVYHYAHLGNLRTIIFADLVNNLFQEADYEVKHQINITDVGHNVQDEDNGQDKMEVGSQRENKTVWEIAKYYTETFYEDLQKLNIDQQKFIWTKATDFIPEQIEMIKILIAKDMTYQTSLGIYFDTSKFPKYSELAKLDLAGLEKGKRVADELDEKKNGSDFALWKFSATQQKRQMEWESPWGIGFPGWHIECSAMSRAILGNNLDIHTGGIDLMPVHHSNEIAQSESSRPTSPTPNPSQRDGGRYVNYWLHVNFLNVDSGKMSKSLDNFLRLNSLKEKNISPLAYKYLLLMTHYRKELKFSWESLEAANTAYQKLLKQIKKIQSHPNPSQWEGHTRICISPLPLGGAGGGILGGVGGGAEYLEKFIKAMHDDLNTSIALATVWSVVNDKELENIQKINLIKTFDKYFKLELI